MNRIDYSIHVILHKDGKEKSFNLPFICDNQVWFQLFKAKGLGHTAEIPAANAKITR
jgi:hypothetical protein